MRPTLLTSSRLFTTSSPLFISNFATSRRISNTSQSLSHVTSGRPQTVPSSSIRRFSCAHVPRFPIKYEDVEGRGGAAEGEVPQVSSSTYSPQVAAIPGGPNFTTGSGIVDAFITTVIGLSMGESGVYLIICCNTVDMIFNERTSTKSHIRGSM